MIWSAPTPSASALKLVKMRWRSTGRSDGADVAGADGQAAVEDGAGLGGQDDVLGGPRPGAPGQPAP